MERKKFLFLGNSHTYFHDMPELFRRMCVEGNYCNAYVTVLAFPYATYEWYLKKETALRFAMQYGAYDYLIMQQAAHSPCPSKEETLRDGMAIINQARHHGILPIQIWPWAEKMKPEHQQEIDDIYQQLSFISDIPLIPAGKLFEKAKSNPNIPELYWNDGEHCSVWGAYGIAALLYTCLSGRSPVGLSSKALSYSKVDDLPASSLWDTTEVDLAQNACKELQKTVLEVKKAYYQLNSFR